MFLLVTALAGCGEPARNQPTADTRASPSAIASAQVIEHHLWNRGGLNWASLTLRDDNGNWITGLSLDDFQLSETLLDAQGGVVSGPQAIAFDQPDYQFDGPGFWERTVSDEKLDIVFIVDASGTMSQEMPAIRDELHDFLDRLLSNRTDFRLGLIGDAWAPGSYDVVPLRGPMMAEELHSAIDDYYLDTAGEWWEPNTGYDSILHALGEMPWRDEADVRRVIVLITDTLPQSAYGNFWHLDSTASNRSGAELALQATGTEFYYSQPATRDEVMSHLDMEYYTRDDTNPRAGCLQLVGGEWDCGFADLGTRLNWPFQQSDVPLASGHSLADSRYYFAWASKYPYIADPDARVRVIIQTDDPANPGTLLQTAFEFSPYEGNLTSITVNMTDARGQPVQEASIHLLAEMGDRRESITSGGPNTPVPGQIQFNVILPGDYRLCAAYNCWPPYYDTFSYSEMDYQGSLAVNLPATGLTTSWQLNTVDAEMDLQRARGLLRDLEHWGVTDRPFRDFAGIANAWLDELAAGGIALAEDEQIRRFSVALSGYVNASGYGEVEGRRITGDFEQVLLKFRDIIERVRDLADDSDTALGVAAVEAGARLDLAALVEIGAGEATVQALKHYAEEELVPEVIDRIVAQIPAGSYKSLLSQMINGLILGHWNDWPALLDSMADLALDESLDQVQALAAAQLTDALFDGLDLSPEAQAMLPYVRTVVDAYARNGFDGIDDAMASVQSQFSGAGSSEQVLVWVGDIFSAMDEHLSAGPLRDFALPMVQLVVRAAIEQDGLDDDAVIRVLAHYFTQRIIVQPSFATPLASELNDALARVRTFVPGAGDSIGDRRTAMNDDFALFRITADTGTDGFASMDDINNDTWKNLARQSPLDDFTQVLSTLSDTLLPPLQALFGGLCTSAYPSACPVARDTRDFIAVLDAVGLMTKVLELSLKTMDLTELSGDMGHTNTVLLVED